MPTPQSPESYKYLPPSPDASRSPCPALNALANHGYIPRDGKDISFLTMLCAVKHVYNLSYPLALLLTAVGYITSGHISFTPYTPYASQTKTKYIPPTLSTLISLLILILTFFPLPLPTWTLSLSSLSTRGHTKIAHDASLVHPDTVPSSAPDPALLASFLHKSKSKSKSKSEAHRGDGLTLADLGALHAQREAERGMPLSRLHEQVALGECGLAWCVMRVPSCAGGGTGDEGEDVIPLSTLEQWFGEERLPEGWWDEVGGGRPGRRVGLLEAGWRARVVGGYARG
ncbi:hypothetical protein Hypma_009266, partial [Hypsizygus marmoreus]